MDKKNKKEKGKRKKEKGKRKKEKGKRKKEKGKRKKEKEKRKKEKGKRKKEKGKRKKENRKRGIRKADFLKSWKGLELSDIRNPKATSLVIRSPCNTVDFIYLSLTFSK